MLKSLEKSRIYIQPSHDIFNCAEEEAKRIMNCPASDGFEECYFENYKHLSYYLFERFVIEVVKKLHEQHYLIMPIEKRDAQHRMRLIGICYQKLS